MFPPPSNTQYLTRQTLLVVFAILLRAQEVTNGKPLERTNMERKNALIFNVI